MTRRSNNGSTGMIQCRLLGYWTQPIKSLMSTMGLKTFRIPDPMELEAVQDKADNYTDEAYDQLISAQVILPQGEGLV
jgi:hypothetical protein